MKNNSIETFFASFEMESDKQKGHFFKGYLEEVIKEFLKDENKETAFLVYTTFFDSYRLKLQGDMNFIDLLDALRSFEENASVLLDKQRDHFIHSVNVFILGLYIYINNKNFRQAFYEYFEKDSYEGKFIDPAEEFLFRWGIASLFHDIGYPLEITNKQISKFLKLVVEKEGKGDTKPYIAFGDFSELNSIPQIANLKRKLINTEGEQIDPYNPLELLASSLHYSLGISYKEVNSYLSNFLEVMQKNGFIDHGYFSAIIVLRWYGYLVEQEQINEDMLYNPILDASSAILLHNYYKNVLQKEPFSLEAMSPADHPIAFLLILCDELQEWNREAYGALDLKGVFVAESNLFISDDELKIHYITYDDVLKETFAGEKEKMLKKLLKLEELFPQNFKITHTSKTDLYIDNIRKNEIHLLPRPFLENIEDMAKKIHDNYNLQQLQRNPNQPLEYPDWDNLPDTLKYSNIRQARAYFDKLKILGLYARRPDTTNCEEEIIFFSPEEIEYLARQEHDSWYIERKENGWVFGLEKDVEKKTSPYMIPYDELDDEVKELDRDAVKNIIPLLQEVGLKVYKQS